MAPDLPTRNGPLGTSGESTTAGPNRDAAPASLGQVLRARRTQLGLSQDAVAKALGTSQRTIHRWEHGLSRPQTYYRRRLATLFGIEPALIAGAAPPVAWHQPHRRNPLFTGREEALEEVHRRLRSGGLAGCSQAICGVAGVGKTVLVLEYAHRFRDEYPAVLWLRAEDGAVLRDGFARLATALGLPEGAGHDQAAAVTAVRRWLEGHLEWLLILDNVGDMSAVEEIVPAGPGHTLLTTQAQATGPLAGRIDLPPLTTDDSALLLLRRAKRLAAHQPLDQASAEDRAGARAIAVALDGLPLALDQAGAYLEETGCDPAGYLARWQAWPGALLGRRGQVAVGHPEPIATTLGLSIARLRDASPAAASLLSVCGFLHADDIPEDLFDTGPHALSEAIASLRSFSLVQYSPARRSFSVHRVVQAVIRECLADHERRQAAERAVALVTAAYAGVDDVVNWAERSRLFPHALAAARHAAELQMLGAGAAELQRRVGSHLRTLGQHAEARALLSRAATVAELAHGSEHAEVGSCLQALAAIHQDLGQYAEAEPLALRSLAIAVRALGPDDPAVALVLNDLGALHIRQGRFRDAELALTRMLAIQERRLGAEHPDLSYALNNLGGLAQMAGRYHDAGSLFARALALRRRTLGPEHPSVASVLTNVGSLALDLGREREAADLLLEAERIFLLTFPSDHPSIAIPRLHRALAHHRLGDLDLADELLGRALTVWASALGEEHPRVAQCLSSLGRLRDDQRRYEEAGALHERAVRIQERVLGPRHPDLATSLLNLARHHALLRNCELAAATGEQAHGIRLAVLGPEHPDTAAARRALDSAFLGGSELPRRDRGR
jgi:tetratricopeptide (TPR) repeat protein/transcriptional regulator with XRE-family HTH domain